jgi:hypothetical protein
MFNKKNKESGIALVDSIYYDLVKGYRWVLNLNGYVCSKGDTVRIHRLITNAPKGLYVDHIDHNKKNNLSSNLRICTNQENQFNRTPRAESLSGCKGVTWNKRRKCWDAHITVNRIGMYLGSSRSLSDVIAIREAANIKYQGDFAYNYDLVMSSLVTICNKELLNKDSG